MSLVIPNRWNQEEYNDSVFPEVENLVVVSCEISIFSFLLAKTHFCLGRHSAKLKILTCLDSLAFRGDHMIKFWSIIKQPISTE